MSVSDSVSDSTSKTAKKASTSSYGDGVIWKSRKPNGVVVWKVEVSLGIGEDGKLRKTRRTASSRAEAIELRRALNAKKAQGALKAESKTTFEDFALHWVREVKALQVRATTASDYEYRVRQYLVPYLGRQALQQIRPVDIQRWSSRLKGSGLSTNTVNGARRILFGIFRHAVRQGLLVSNPVEATDALRRQQNEKSQVRAHWSRAEALMALESARANPSMDLFIHLAISLGLRHGELLGLKWSAIDFDSNSLSVIETLRDLRTVNPDGSGKVRPIANPPKTSSSRRTLSLSHQNLEALERHKMMQSVRRLQAGDKWQETGYVFTSKLGTPLNQANSLKAFRSFITESGLRYIRIHDIRHTTAVLALEAGATLESISQAFGHSGTEITKTVYAPYVQSLNDKFVETLSSYLSES